LPNISSKRFQLHHRIRSTSTATAGAATATVGALPNAPAVCTLQRRKLQGKKTRPHRVTGETTSVDRGRCCAGPRWVAVARALGSPREHLWGAPPLPRWPAPPLPAGCLPVSDLSERDMERQALVDKEIRCSQHSKLQPIIPKSLHLFSIVICNLQPVRLASLFDWLVADGW
jgi:hypothetical protein